MEPDDAELVSRTLLDRDPRAFDQLVLRHQSPIRCLLRRLTGGNEALADDLAQDAFFTAWRKLASFRNEARFSTWLHKIAVNCVLSRRKGLRAEYEVAEPAAGLPDRADLGSGAPPLLLVIWMTSGRSV